MMPYGQQGEFQDSPFVCRHAENPDNGAGWPETFFERKRGSIEIRFRRKNRIKNGCYNSPV